MPNYTQDTTKEQIAVPRMVELEQASIVAVAGGINPQPLPPRSPERLD